MDEGERWILLRAAERRAMEAEESDGGTAQNERPRRSTVLSGSSSSSACTWLSPRNEKSSLVRGSNTYASVREELRAACRCAHNQGTAPRTAALSSSRAFARGGNSASLVLVGTATSACASPSASASSCTVNDAPRSWRYVMRSNSNLLQVRRVTQTTNHNIQLVSNSTCGAAREERGEDGVARVETCIVVVVLLQIGELLCGPVASLIELLACKTARAGRRRCGHISEIGTQRVCSSHILLWCLRTRRFIAVTRRRNHWSSGY